MTETNTPDALLAAACERLSELSDRTCAEGPWESGAFGVLAQHGVLARFLPEGSGGTGGGPAEVLRLLTAIARRCLTTALAVSQWLGAAQIMAAAELPARARLLDGLADGRRCATIGISQLTTSHRHASRPLMVASFRDQWVLNGLCPWVTGADTVDIIVTGAVIEGSGVAYFVVDRRAVGIDVDAPMRLVALSGSRTSAVKFHDVRPVAMISADSAGAPRAGGLATSAVGVGAALGSVDYLRRRAADSPGGDLESAADHLERRCLVITDRLSRPESIDVDECEALRSTVNGLVARAAMASLLAAKGTGFVEGHPAGRAVCEAQFFLVWSSPPGVTQRVLRDLAFFSLDQPVLDQPAAMPGAGSA